MNKSSKTIDIFWYFPNQNALFIQHLERYYIENQDPPPPHMYLFVSLDF